MMSNNSWCYIHENRRQEPSCACSDKEKQLYVYDNGGSHGGKGSFLSGSSTRDGEGSRIWSFFWSTGILLLLLVLFPQPIQGKVFEDEEVGRYSNPVKFSVQLLTSKPKFEVKLLVLKSGREEVVADSAMIKKKDLTFDNTHELGIRHVVEGGQHKLKVIVDDRPLNIKNGDVVAWEREFSFSHISLRIYGRANITEYPVPVTTNPTYVKKVIEPSLEDVKDAKDTLTDEDDVDDKEHNDQVNGQPDEHPAPMETSGINFNSSAESEEELRDTQDPMEFLFVMGRFKGVPVIVFIVGAFLIGAGIGSVTTILCEKYCRCCHKNDLSAMAYHKNHKLKPYTSLSISAPLDDNTPAFAHSDNVSTLRNSKTRNDSVTVYNDLDRLNPNSNAAAPNTYPLNLNQSNNRSWQDDNNDEMQSLYNPYTINDGSSTFGRLDQYTESPYHC